MTSRTSDIHCRSCWNYGYSVMAVSEEDRKYVCRVCLESRRTPWFDPDTKPVRIGWYEASFFDCGFQYEWRVWWDGSVWRDKPDGNSLIDQNQTWRGLLEGV